MDRYDYREHEIQDIKDWISENIDPKDYADSDELAQYLNETLFNEDSVTGNASGSYTFSSWEAEENICHNLNLLFEAEENFGYENNMLKINAESCDVTIRCYLLAECIDKALQELDLSYGNDGE